MRRFAYNVGRANEILDSLGWVDTNGDGIREDKAGNTIEFTLITNGDNTVRGAVTEHIAEGLLAIGVKANYDFGRVRRSRRLSLTASYEWEAMVVGFTSGTDPYSGIAIWHSSESLHLWYPNQPEPATEWEALIDHLYIQASQELDHEMRLELYHYAQEIIAENVPVIYTTLSERLTATRNTVWEYDADAVRALGRAVSVLDGSIGYWRPPNRGATLVIRWSAALRGDSYSGCSSFLRGALMV